MFGQYGKEKEKEERVKIMKLQVNRVVKLAKEDYIFSALSVPAHRGRGDKRRSRFKKSVYLHGLCECTRPESLNGFNHVNEA
jgi:hypothetical protein